MHKSISIKGLSNSRTNVGNPLLEPTHPTNSWFKTLAPVVGSGVLVVLAVVLVVVIVVSVVVTVVVSGAVGCVLLQVR